MLYPIVLVLAGRLVLVVGGGKVAARKVRGLLEAGAVVRLVAPELGPEAARLKDERKLDWQPRAFRPEDLEGCWLALAATDDEAVNRAVAEAAEAAGIFCNLAAEPERGSFRLPASFRRGELIVSVSTGGASPLLAARIRDDLAARFDSAWGDYLDLLARVRRAVLAKGRPAEENKAVFQAVLEADLLSPLRAGDRALLSARLSEASGLSLADLDEKVA